MGPGSERAASRQESLLDDEPIGEIPPAPVHFQRDGDDHHVPRAKLQKDSRLKQHRNWVMFLLPVVGIPVVILISLFLYLGIEMQGSGVQDSAPLVAAPEGPDKVKPTNEGGLAVEGMDSAVLNQTANNQAQKTTEQLLPPPEEPMTPPAAAQPATAGDGTAAADAAAPTAPSVEVPLAPPPATVPTTSEPASSSSTNNDSTNSAATNNSTANNSTANNSATNNSKANSSTANNSSTASTASTAAANNTAAPAPAITTAPATTTAPAAAPATTAPATTQTASAGSYRVQLVAVKSEGAAKTAWASFQKKYPDLLKSLALRVEKIDLGGNGVFYRVQAGPLANRTAAADLCSKLGQRGQSCMVVRP
jgi:hypothetical protein